uniref:Cytochrome P450 n=1 Tax=Panagrolaimus sp. ES5 TaxID=591445 RepID=A0AC34FGP9_9BILA
MGIVYYFYLKHRSTYFQHLGIPQPPITSTFLGNFEEFEKNHQQWETLKRWHKTYGPSFGMLLGAHRVVVTADLDILNEVYIKQFHTFQARMIHPSVAVDQENGPQMNVFLGQGNRWKRLRALFSASLTVSKVKSVDPIMKQAHEELIEVLRKHENGVINVKPYNVITARENESVEEKENRHQDFLDFLREAQEDDLDTTNKPDFDTKIPKKLTRDELIGSSQAFLVAGGETTATLITHCLYELARHPEFEQIILEEINDHIKTPVNFYHFNTLQLMVYF